MERWGGKVAVVTGASCGIGASIAERLVRRGMVVIGGARSVAKMEKLAQTLKDSGAKGQLHPHFLDARSDGSILDLFKFADTFGPVALLVNNAGIAVNAPLLTGATEEWREMLEVNVLAYAVATREAYTRMKEHSDMEGHIVNINSISGHSQTWTPGCPNIHFYESTKFAVTALTEGVRQELQAAENGKIRVSQISPGWVRTNIMTRYYGDETTGAKLFDTVGTSLDGDNIADIVEYIVASPLMMQVHDVVVRGLKET